MTEPRSYRLSVSRIRLNIVEWGDPAAPPLILQHGGRDHARSWEAIATAFAPDYRVIAPDVRGHGDSDWANDGSYHMLDYVEDFTGIVRALDLPPCPIVGHSLGGSIVTRFAGLYPERVTRLVNIEGLGDGAERLNKKEGIRGKLDAMRHWIDKRAAVVTRTPRDFPDLATLTARIREGDKRLSIEFAEHLARHAARPNPDGTLRIKYDPTFGGEAPTSIDPEFKQLLWSEITCPVLLIYGAESWASNPAEDGRARHFRDARVEMFESAGHWVHHDRREDFIAMVRAFIG